MHAIPVAYGPLEDFEVTPANLSTWSANHISRLKELFVNRHGEVPPIVLFLAANPEDQKGVVEGFFPLGMFLNRGDEGKDVAAVLLRALFARVKAFACLTVTEAWVTALDLNEAARPDKLLFEVPAKKEALIFVAETMDGSQLTQCQFSRENGEIILGETIEMETGTTHGRFVNLLEDSREAQVAAQGLHKD